MTERLPQGFDDPDLLDFGVRCPLNPVQCPGCSGDGEHPAMPAGLRTCSWCGGSGVVSEDRANDWPPT